MVPLTPSFANNIVPLIAVLFKNSSNSILKSL